MSSVIHAIIHAHERLSCEYQGGKTNSMCQVSLMLLQPADAHFSSTIFQHLTNCTVFN